MRSARGLHPVLLTLAVLGLSIPALGADLEIVSRTEVAEIGGELVLELRLVPGPGETVEPGGVAVELVRAPAALGEPYPLKALSADGGVLAYEWAAPVAEDAEPGAGTLALRVTVPVGDGAPRTIAWQGEVEIGYGDEWSADRISSFIDRRGLLPFLALVFGFGLLMSLSPCIYPMIPITLAVIGARSQEKGAWHGLTMSVIYVIGMALVYAVLGALSATVFSGITAFMQSPAVLVPLAVLLIFLSFSMFGAFELQAPAFLRDRLAGPGGSGRGGVFGVFSMGMVAGLVASPCVGPFLAALLVWVGTTGNWVLGFFSLFTFGIGMGLLLIGVGTFPALLGSMPSSGGWMETVKKGMGLLLVAMAFWFVRPEVVTPEKIFYPLLGATVVLVAVFMGAFDALAPGAHWWDRARKGLGLIAFAAGLFILGSSFWRYGLLGPAAPPPGAEGSAVVAAAEGPRSGPTPVREQPAPDEAPALPAKVPWEVVKTGSDVQAFLDARRAEAKAAGRPVMIDFWATWCVYCKKLDKDVWNQPEVVAESLRFAVIKIDATAPDDDEMTAIKEEFRVPGLPRVIFIDSRGEILHGKSAGYKPAEEMLTVMRSIR